MSKQETNKRSTHQAAGTSTDKQLRELDAELSRRLDATLGAPTKFRTGGDACARKTRTTGGGIE